MKAYAIYLAILIIAVSFLALHVIKAIQPITQALTILN